MLHKTIILPALCATVFLLPPYNYLYAKESSFEEHTRKSTYRSIRNHLFYKMYKENTPIERVSNVNGKQETWKIYELEDGKKIWEILSHTNDAYYTEKYYSKNGNLVYALDGHRYVSQNDQDGSLWECEFFIKDGKIYSEISLGHGKTEHDDWDPNIIFKMFEKRKKEFELLQNEKKRI